MKKPEPPQIGAVVQYGDVGQAEVAEAQLKESAEKLERQLRPDIKNLIATELAMALYAPTQLLKLRHIFEAFQLLTDEDRVVIIKNPEVIRMINRYAALTTNMSDLQKVEKDKAFIPFDFPEEEAPICLKFYVQNYANYLGAANWDEYRTRLMQVISSGSAPIALCFRVKNAFINSTMPFALSVFRLIFSSYIGVAELEAAMERVGGYQPEAESE